MKKYPMSPKKSRCSTKKYFMSTKTRWCCIKKIFCARKGYYLFQNGAPYYTTHPKAYEMDCKIYKTRSSRSQMFFKIGFPKKFAFFVEKRLCSSLFLIKLQAFRDETLLKRDSSTGVFLCNLWKKTSKAAASVIISTTYIQEQQDHRKQ